MVRGYPMSDKKFDPKKLRKLNDSKRLIDIPPDYIRRKLNIRKPDRVVEIGAGTGFFSIAFLELFQPSTLYACDLSEVMIDWMTENVSPRYPNIVPVRTEEGSVPLQDEIADLVFMINLHHELEDPSKTVQEAFRLLKRGGEIFIVDWKKEDMAEGPPEEIRCVPKDVKNQLMKSGFSNVSIFDDLPKHFLVIGEKDLQLTSP